MEDLVRSRNRTGRYGTSDDPAASVVGKIRDIALLCIMHQLIGHITKLMMKPLIQARLLPTQHASIPGHGQTMLKDQMNVALFPEGIAGN